MQRRIPIDELFSHSVMLAACTIGFLALSVVVGLCFYRRNYLGAKIRFLWAGATLLGAGVMVFNAYHRGLLQSNALRNVDEGDALMLLASVIASGLVVVLIIPLALRLYGKWTGRNLTDQEKQPGIEAVQAFLGGRTLPLALLVAVCLWLGYDWPFWPTLLGLVALVVSYPLINTLLNTPDTAGAGQASAYSEDVSDERDSVMKLLEEEKISAEEAAELISALGTGAAPAGLAGQSPALTGGARKAAIIGAVLVAVGFFLPWFSVDVGKEMSRMQKGLWSSMKGFTPPGFNAHAPQMPPEAMPTPAPSGVITRAAGPDIDKGLGWVVLLGATGAALLLFLPTKLTAKQTQMICLAVLAFGGLVIAYILTEGEIRHASLGIVAVGIGYAIQFAGVASARRSPTGAAPEA